MLLGRLPVTHADDIHVAEHLIQSQANGCIAKTGAAKATGAPAGFFFRANAALMDVASAVSTSCSTPITIAFEPVNYVRRAFQIRKSSRVQVGRLNIVSGVGGDGYLIPSDHRWTVEHDQAFECLALRFDMAALKDKLSAMTGEPIDTDIEFEAASAAGEAHNRLLRHAAIAFAHEINELDQSQGRISIYEMQQQMAVRFLLYHRHSRSSLLELEPRHGREAQVRIMEEFIVANCEQPLDIAGVAREADISIRSAFRTFRALRGCSPHDFVKNVRLDRTRRMLLDDGGGASVMAIAYRCGFHNLGHFANAYRGRFGELPSHTLRNACPELRETNVRNARAFSSEVGTGSRKENASKQKTS